MQTDVQVYNFVADRLRSMAAEKARLVAAVEAEKRAREAAEQRIVDLQAKVKEVEGLIAQKMDKVEDLQSSLSEVEAKKREEMENSERERIRLEAELALKSSQAKEAVDELAALAEIAADPDMPGPDAEKMQEPMAGAPTVEEPVAVVEPVAEEKSTFSRPVLTANEVADIADAIRSRLLASSTKAADVEAEEHVITA